ncbi:MAG: S8 family peptidase [Lachnospiraceae bacterium]
MIEIIVEYYDNDYTSLMKQYNASNVVRISERYVVVYGEDGVMAPYSYKNYTYSQIPNCFGLMAETNMDAVGVTRVRSQPALGLRGQRVLIAVLDTGIDYQNPLFRYADNTTRIMSIYDQETDRVYSEEEINLALESDDPLSVVPATDTNGHGTFLAGIAGGGVDEENDFTGAAPDAQFIIVKLREASKNLVDFYQIHTDGPVYSEADILLGLRMVASLSVFRQRPVVVLLGVGSNQGDHDGTGPLNEFLEAFAVSTGACAVIAGGNEGQVRRHYHAFGIPNRDEAGVSVERNEETVEIEVGSNIAGFTMEMWGKSPNRYQITVQSPGGEVIPALGARTRLTTEFRFVLEETKLTIHIDTQELASGEPVIVLQFRQPTEGIWKLTITEEGLPNLGFHMWMPITQFLNENTFFLRSNPDTTLTSPSNADNVITVVAYDHRKDTIYPPNSRGYTRLNYIKPDLVAPGVEIKGPGLRNRYVVRSGSSVAAAHVAGVSALLLEWGLLRGNQTSMNGVTVRNYLILGATRKPTLTYPNRQWGYGTVDLYNTFVRISR